MEVINCYSGHTLPLFFELRQNSSKLKKIVKKRQEKPSKNPNFDSKPPISLWPLFFSVF
jgi:hypothetical protein